VATLAERELRVRYKQTVLGLAWAVLTPVTLMVVFTLFFQRVAQVDTGGAPYPLFAYLGLLPWTFFSTSVSQGGQSLVQNVQLLNKVYCPREVFPVASVAVAASDTAMALVALGALFLVNGFLPKATSAWVPLLLTIQVAFTLGIALVTSAVVVYLRDLRHALPIILQLGLFATPVAYGIEVVPEHLQSLYSAMNPLAPVIDGYRRTILLGQAPNWQLLLPGAVTAAVVLVTGYLAFKRLETGFADVA
jgi:ABC-2 type transport system permease protein/lipopolysaccharide transport system permease protein